MPQVLASKLSLFGLPIKIAMERVRAAGFDGIEVLLTDRFRNYTWRCQYLAKELGLILHFHQAWSSDEDPTDKKFVILGKLGYLPQQRYALRQHIPASIRNKIVVIQADRINERFGNHQWLQTDCIFKNGRSLLSLAEFAQAVNKLNLPVVFDTQHYLEWKLGIFRDLSKLPTDQKKLLELLEEGWATFGPHAKEIHLNDWAPNERNVFTGTGIAPLKEFCKMVKSSGWNGYVVPEIGPKVPIPRSLDTLKKLRETVESYFA